MRSCSITISRHWACNAGKEAMLKVVIILLYLSKEAFDAILDFLDSQNVKKELPENVRDVYSEEEYRNWRAYEKEGGRIDVIENIVSITFNLFLLIANIYAWGFGLLSGMNPYLQYLVFTILFSVVTTAIGIPFSYYNTFVIETKYGLNKSTKKTFWLDQLKSFIIGNAISYSFIVLVMLLFGKFGNMAILWSSVIVMVIILAVMLIIVPIMRIYNKFQPLEDGELKAQLLALCDRYGVGVKKIVVRDASRRTTKANAFCTGIGNRKTISLDDNLVNAYSPEEITAVFAHEFAHARFHHQVKSLPLSICSVLITFAALGMVLNMPGLYSAFGFTGINYYFATSMTGVILWPVSTVLEIIANYFSRKHEYQADAFAAKEGYGNDLIAALKRLHKESLADINPHPAVVFLEYSHPTLSQRITAIENVMNVDKKAG